MPNINSFIFETSGFWCVFFLTYWINQTQKYYKEENIKKFTVKLKDGNE